MNRHEDDTDLIPATPDTMRNIMGDMQEFNQAWAEVNSQAKRAFQSMENVIDRGYPSVVAKYVNELIEKLPKGYIKHD